MTTDTIGGVWSYSCSLAAALTELGSEVHLVTIGPRPSADQRAMLRVRGVDIIETDLALEWQDPEGADVPNAKHLFAELEARICPDVIHLNGFREATFDWIAPAIVVAHSCVNSWARACNDMAWLLEPRWQNYTQAVGDGLNKAHAWISPSHAFHRVICDLYKPVSPGFVIWNGVTPDLSWSTKRAFVLTAGRIWDRAKNISTLAALAPELEWPLLIAGRTANETATGATWLGSLDPEALRTRMRQAALFVSLACYEPFGLAVLEAASASCALVLSDIPTFRELWDGAAVFVNPADAGELRHALAQLCCNYRRRTQLQHAARERSQRYSLTRMAEAYRTLYVSSSARAERSGEYLLEAHA
ncbi:glycosyltransferase family 4 protein [Bradyrhizobium sp. ORS 111]|uniref:glycosyltransferase family 4 protein n=1 Tax=Bradyrhizobium sp. ORS 111 TaxID=1685958 RepID=UPI00388DCD63